MTRFRAKVLLAGKTATGVEVPAKVVEALGSSRRPLVRVTINGHTYRNAIAVMGGKYMLGINSDVREAARVKAGEHIEVDVELDTEKREVEVPAELKKALTRDAATRKYFESLSYSKKVALVNPIANGKTVETRERNLAKAMATLQARQA